MELPFSESLCTITSALSAAASLRFIVYFSGKDLKSAMSYRLIPSSPLSVIPLISYSLPSTVSLPFTDWIARESSYVVETSAVMLISQRGKAS